MVRSVNFSSRSYLSWSTADTDVLRKILHPLGLSKKRTRSLIAMSAMYVDVPPSYYIGYKSRCKGKYPPTPVSHLPGSGRYALDSYRIFCTGGGEWKDVIPQDKELRRYMASGTLLSE